MTTIKLSSPSPDNKMTPTTDPSTVTTNDNTTRRRSSIALSLAAVGGLTLAACGGSSDDNSGIASLDGATDEAAADIDPELAMVDYQECLAENGVDLSIELGSGGGSFSMGGSEADPQAGGFANIDLEEFRAASEACADLAEAAMGAFTPDAQEQAAMQDAQLRFQECMDDKGLGAYTGMMAASSTGLALDGSTGASDPQSSGSLDDVDPDVLADALDECAVVFDELEGS
ncbi:MAG: hypothetical protein AAGF73_04980 [Actinomycetota bacterium]